MAAYRILAVTISDIPVTLSRCPLPVIYRKSRVYHVAPASIMIRGLVTPRPWTNATEIRLFCLIRSVCGRVRTIYNESLHYTMKAFTIYSESLYCIWVCACALSTELTSLLTIKCSLAITYLFFKRGQALIAY